MAYMKPIQTTFDPDEIDSSMHAISKMPRAIPVALAAPLTQFGTATVDGIALSGCEQVKNALNRWFLMVPVGEVAFEYDRSYTVKLEGFRGTLGKKLPPCTFQLKTVARKMEDPVYAEHDLQALEAAREGMVLLKNDSNTLPMKKDSVLNCFGNAQYMYRISATGASKINPRWAPNFHQAVEDHSDFTLNRELADAYRVHNGTPEASLLEKARAASDTAVIFLGRHSGECQDNRPIAGQYYLTEDEKNMIRAVCAAFDKTVLILNVGYPIEMRWIMEQGISSILYTGFAGMLSSYALLEILDGRTNPSGCLADTWSLDYYDSPASRNQPTLKAGEPTPKDNAFGVHIYYEEDIYNGYRYFDTFQKKVAYPFGHGLSYTDFSVRAEGFKQTAEGICLNVVVANVGFVSGKKVVQLYASAPDGKLEKPAHVLVGFEKTKLLAPGESQNFEVRVSERSMASFDEENATWVLEKGTYRIFVGSLNHLQFAGDLYLEHGRVLETVHHYGCPPVEIDRLTKAYPEVVGKKTKIVPMYKRIGIRAKRMPYHPQRLPRYDGKKILWGDLKKNHALLDAFVSQMRLGELAKMNVCAGGLWGEGENGCAGHTYSMERYDLPSFCVSDANAGVNIRKPNIGFPTSSVIASTFNKDIAYTVGRVIAEESLENGIFLNLGPGMNLHRNMLCGRQPEYFSEDPFLTGIMAGYHGKGLEENGLGCCYKHLFCNSSDLSRMGSQSVVTERALRELYFYCFELAFSIQKPSAVMTSYNSLNGIYPAESAELIQGLVREEWGFDGFVMSDWNSYFSVNAVNMVNAGNCWLTLGGMFWVWVIRLAAYTGFISRAVLEHNVRWLIKTILNKNKAQ